LNRRVGYSCLAVFSDDAGLVQCFVNDDEFEGLWKGRESRLA
jgi:hypothetical protein